MCFSSYTAGEILIAGNCIFNTCNYSVFDDRGLQLRPVVAPIVREAMQATIATRVAPRCKQATNYKAITQSINQSIVSQHCPDLRTGFNAHSAGEPHAQASNNGIKTCFLRLAPLSWAANVAMKPCSSDCIYIYIYILAFLSCRAHPRLPKFWN